jgi:hypothetical protein
MLKPGDDAEAAARRLLREKYGKHHAFNQPIHYPPRSLDGPGRDGTSGGGDRSKTEDQPHAKQIPHAPQPAVWSAHKSEAGAAITVPRLKAAPSGVKLAPRSVVSCKGFHCAQ